MTRQSHFMHILLVITQGHWGGAQQHVFDIATSLASTHTVTVAIGTSAQKNDLRARCHEWNTHHKQSPITLVDLKHLTREICPKKDLKAIDELKHLIDDTQPDITHLHSTKAGIIGGQAAKKSQHCPKVLYTVHGWVFHERVSPIKKWLYKKIEQFFAKDKDLFILLSQQAAKDASTLGIPTSRQAIVPIGIDPIPLLPRNTARQVLQESIGTPVSPDTPWIGCIANLYQTKGIDLLLQAVSQSTMLKNTPVIIIGDGPQRAQLATQQHALGLDHMYFAGFQDQAAKLLSAFDAFVLPSRKEGMPYVILEAMHAHLPIIATDTGAIRSMLEAYQTKDVVDVENIPALRQALEQQLTKNKQQKKTRAPKLGTRADMIKAIVECYTTVQRLP